MRITTLLPGTTEVIATDDTPPMRSISDLIEAAVPRAPPGSCNTTTSLLLKPGSRLSINFTWLAITKETTIMMAEIVNCTTTNPCWKYPDDEDAAIGRPPDFN